MTHLLKRALCLILMLLPMGLLTSCEDKTTAVSGPQEKVSIAIPAGQARVAIVLVAANQGYFAEEGVDLTIQEHQFGKRAMEALFDGKADLALSAEAPVMFAILSGKELAVLATIDSSSENEGILVLKDRGIQTLSDLRGKRIGVTLGTSADFFLSTQLTSGGLDRGEVEIVPLKPAEMPEAMKSGKVDAVSIWDFFLSEMQNEFGDKTFILRDKTVYTSFYCLASLQEFARSHKDALIKIMRALVRAEDFIKNNPAEAKKIITTSAGVDGQILEKLWDRHSFKTTLNQSLLIVLEDEANWAIENQRVKPTKNYRIADYLYSDHLAAAKPDAVRLIR